MNRTVSALTVTVKGSPLMKQPKSLRAHLLLTTAATSLTLAGFGGQSAWAGDCLPPNANVITCSGPADVGGNDSPQNLTGGVGPNVITADETFGIDTRTGGGSAITITVEGGLTFVDILDGNGNGSLIAGAEDGINAENTNGGAVSITTMGPVIGVDGTGLRSYNGPGGSDLTVSSADVSGGQSGIDAKNLGTGDLMISTTGLVTGGMGEGIEAQNYNGGAVSITAEDTVSSSGGDGIFAVNQADAGATSLTIAAAGVSGALFGIYARSEGSGDLSVTTDGVVTGGSGRGIDASNFNGGALNITANDTVMSSDSDGILAVNQADADATSLTISATAVSGGQHGILAESRGAGDLTITADDTVTGGDAAGIDARITNDASGGDVIIMTNDVNGGTTGIVARHEGTGSIEITANGTVVGGLSNLNPGGGVFAKIDNEDATGDLTISAAAVSGVAFGIIANNTGAGAITVTASGPVTATGLNGDGIDVDNTTKAIGNVTVSAGSVEGGRFGIIAENDGAGSLYVTATGTVTGQTSDGILARANGLNVGVSAADVRGGNSGIFAQNVGTGFLSVTAGNVTGDNDFGIRASLNNGTDLTISSADVHAGSIGIFASNNGNGSLSITAGNVSGGLGGGGNGITANLGVSGDTLTISAAGVSGADTGISARNRGSGLLSVATSGPVFGASADGIFAKIDNATNGADLTISAEAVTGAVNGIQADHQGSGNIIISASGPVEGIGDDGITFVNTAAGGAVTIEADAVIGGRSGIRAEHQGTGALSVTAGGDVTGDTSEGIFARIDNAASGADLTISAMAVSGGTDGIDAKNLGSGNVFVTAAGPVTADGDGYGIRAGNFAGGDVSITAADTVTAPGTGIAGRNYGPMAGNVTITAADVTGRTGIVASTQGMGSVSVTATGTVIGTAEFGGGINALNTGGTDISISTVDVIGGARGISARNTGTGSTIIDADGAVTGLGDDGINAYTGAGGDALTIEAEAVSGFTSAIRAENKGSGHLSITTADAVTGGNYGISADNRGGGDLSIVAGSTAAGTARDGIRARNFAGGDRLTISAASVIGGGYGIFAKNEGDAELSVTTTGLVSGGTGDGIVARNYNGGALNITTKGTVISTGGEGIYANNYTDTTSLTISAAGVSASQYGIIGRNEGIGDFRVTSTGLVTSTIGAGIFAENLNGGALSINAEEKVESTDSNGISARNLVDTTDLTIVAASISAGKQAIEALNEGTGDLDITTTGPATGGTYGGIVARNFNGGALGITAMDTVTAADGAGIYARNGIGGTNLTISTDAVSGESDGIFAENAGSGLLSITSSGAVTGLNGDGIDARDGGTVGQGIAIWTQSVHGDEYGISATGISGDISVTADETVRGERASGIRAELQDLYGTGDITVSAADVHGGNFGIIARSRADGSVSVSASGPIVGLFSAGVRADGGSANSTDVTVDVGDVSGGQRGINAANLGTGHLTVITDGLVTSGAREGIRAQIRNAGSGGNLTVSAADVTGGSDGILALNRGTGALTITATGTVTGGMYSGIAATIDNPDSTGDLSISAVDVTGNETGIVAENRGSGDLIVFTKGSVEGGTEDGMYLRNANGGALSVTASEHVSSAELNGIRAINYAGGSSMTVSTASVSGFTGGIVATNAGTGDIAVSATGEVSGGPLGDGMRVRNLFGGSLSITTEALVSSGLGQFATGIFAENRAGGADLSISATDVFGNRNGITARHYGDGALDVTTTGSVTGATGVGIRAYNLISGSDITVSAASVTGGIDAIQVDNKGSGDLLVTVTGTVSGGTGAGINNIDTDAQGGTIVVTETASVDAASGVAVTDGDGGTLLSSRGALAGDVMLNGGEDAVALIDGSATGLLGLGDGDDTLEIFGAGAGGGWDDADFSGTFDGNLGQVLQLDGGDGVDTVELFGVTAASEALGVPTGLEALALSDNTLVQANDTDLTAFGAVFVDPTSTLQAEGNSPSNTVVGSLGNEGVVDLADGEANDVLTVAGDYAGATGSQVWLDLDAAAGIADRLVIEGDLTDVSVGPFTVIHDQTLIDLNLIGAGSRTLGDGIRLIEVGGAVDEDDFALAGPVESDLFAYELVFEDGAHVLRSDFFDQIYLYENLPGAMQTIGLALTGQLVERVGVRSAVPSTLPDADGNPVAGGAPVDTAIWGRAVGLSVESEGDLDSVTGTSFDQTVGFVQAGVDVTVLERQSGRLLIGALGHWGTSALDVNTFDGDEAGSANFDFFGGGLTATWYSTRGWYFDNVVQYTAYDIDISTASRFAATSTDGYAITTSHEVGYRLPIGETAALVPQAQLTYQHIDFDDFTDPDGVRISLDDGDSLVGRAGFAFENSAAIGSALATGYVEANLLHEFLGDNSVNVATGFGTTAISQETRGTSVELGFGGTVAVSRGVSLYGEVDYTIPFDNGVQGFQALGGIRVNLNPPPPPPPPAPVIAPVAETAFIVFFDWDRADLTSEANLVLDDVVVVANETGYASIRLDGYTDLSGSAAYNLGLSERRANSVANGLIARGIAPDEIVIRAFGEENPLVPTPDGVREPQNRRVEIFLS